MKLSGPGVTLMAQLAALQPEPRRHLIRWRWYLGWWDWRRKRRRGVPVA